MWNSVSRAVGYGWSVGLSLIRKMSDKIFDNRNNEEEDVSFVTFKLYFYESGADQLEKGCTLLGETIERVTIFTMKGYEKEDSKCPLRSIEVPEETATREKNKALEQQFDPREQPKLDTDRTPPEVIQTSVLYDSLDETSPRPTAANCGAKRVNKIGESHGRVAQKTDNRARHKVSSDIRWNHVGSGSEDYRWCNSLKLGKSQSDLSSSKWFSNVDSSVKSDSSRKSPSHTLNSSESDIFPSRSGISSNPNEVSSSRPHPLFKSQSSSQIPSVRGSNAHSTRQWKCGSSSSTRPVSVVSMQQSHAPCPQYISGHGSYARSVCVCADSCGKKTNRTESVLSLAEDVETPEGLSWRRLHMSRAKLKATATTSELLSGFAMVAMVELQINKPTAVPEWLFVLFAVCTTILVSVHIFALMISTYLLPNIDAVSKLHVSSLVTESPHDRMKSFIELAWAFSTILGLFLFLVEIAILCWVKFWDYSFTAAMSATMIIMPVLVLFVAFAMHFYHSLVVIKCKTSVSNMQELENMKKQLDNVCPA